MEHEGSPPSLQKPTTGPYPEPAESSLPYRFLSPFCVNMSDGLFLLFECIFTC
jgi:hypothetical protein